MISIFALGSDLPEIEVIRSALSEEPTSISIVFATLMGTSPHRHKCTYYRLP